MLEKARRWLFGAKRIIDELSEDDDEPGDPYTGDLLELAGKLDGLAEAADLQLAGFADFYYPESLPEFEEWDESHQQRWEALVNEVADELSEDDDEPGDPYTGDLFELARKLDGLAKEARLRLAGLSYPESLPEFKKWTESHQQRWEALVNEVADELRKAHFDVTIVRFMEDPPSLRIGYIEVDPMQTRALEVDSRGATLNLHTFGRMISALAHGDRLHGLPAALEALEARAKRLRESSESGDYDQTTKWRDLAIDTRETWLDLAIDTAETLQRHGWPSEPIETYREGAVVSFGNLQIDLRGGLLDVSEPERPKVNLEGLRRALSPKPLKTWMVRPGISLGLDWLFHIIAIYNFRIYQREANSTEAGDRSRLYSLLPGSRSTVVRHGSIHGGADGR